MEFGLKQWDEQQTVAEFLFEEMDQGELADSIDNDLLIRIYKLYRAWYEEGLQPTSRNFLYYDDKELNDMVISLNDMNTDISHNWSKHYEGHINTREDLYKEEVTSTLNYLKLRKIKRLIEMNQREMEQATQAEDQMLFLETHQHLKEMEIRLTKLVGTVIFR